MGTRSHKYAHNNGRHHTQLQYLIRHACVCSSHLSHNTADSRLTCVSASATRLARVCVPSCTHGVTVCAISCRVCFPIERGSDATTSVGVRAVAPKTRACRSDAPALFVCANSYMHMHTKLHQTQGEVSSLLSHMRALKARACLHTCTHATLMCVCCGSTVAHVAHVAFVVGENVMIGFVSCCLYAFVCHVNFAVQSLVRTLNGTCLLCVCVSTLLCRCSMYHLAKPGAVKYRLDSNHTLPLSRCVPNRTTWMKIETVKAPPHTHSIETKLYASRTNHPTAGHSTKLSPINFHSNTQSHSRHNTVTRRHSLTHHALSRRVYFQFVTWIEQSARPPARVCSRTLTSD